MVQVTIEDFLKGQELKQDGMTRAVEHADRVFGKWSDRAFDLLVTFARHKREFMIEDVRRFATEAGLPEPPSLRAWGSVALRASREGIIKRIGFKSVSNPRAHCAPCSVWGAIG